MEETYDFAIVGAGIAGASVAYRLAPHARVLLLEQESQPGYHSTGRSAAMFMATYGTPTIRALTRASRQFYDRPPAEFTPHPLLAARGALYVAKIDQQDLLSEFHATLRAEEPDVRRLDASQTLELVPVLKSGLVLGGVLDPTAYDIDVHALHQGFLRGARHAGGTIRTGAGLVGAERQGGQWRLKLAGGSAVHAHNVVDAAGAWADVVADLCGARPVGIEPRRRTAFTFSVPDGVDSAAWPAVIGIDESYYFKPDAGQLLGSPANADATVPHDVVPEELDVALGIHQIEDVTTLSIRRPRHIWSGLRSFVSDGDMVVGWDDQCEGFFWLAAQGGYGIQTAAAVSELAQALLLNRAPPPHILHEGVSLQAMQPSRLRQAGHLPGDAQ